MTYECPNCHGLNGLHSGMDQCPTDRQQMQKATGLSDDEMRELVKLGAMNLLARQQLLNVLSFEPHEFDTFEELDEALSDPPTDEQVASAVEAARQVLDDTA